MEKDHTHIYEDIWGEVDISFPGGCRQVRVKIFKGADLKLDLNETATELLRLFLKRSVDWMNAEEHAITMLLSQIRDPTEEDLQTVKKILGV